MYISALVHVSWLDDPSVGQVGVVVDVIEKLDELFDVLFELMLRALSLHVESNW